MSGDKIILFEDVTADTTSQVFRLNVSRISGTINRNAFLLIRGSVGGGRLSLQIADLNGDFIEIEEDSNSINSRLATDNTKASVIPFLYSASERLRLVLTGSTNPNLWVEGSNCRLE